MSDLEPITTFLDNIKHRKLAEEILEVFSKNSNTFEQYDNLSKSYFKIKDYFNSIRMGERALSLASTSEQLYVTRSNLINVYNHANYPEDALRYILFNEQVIPYDIDIILEKAYSYFLLNRKSEAEQILQNVLDKDENLNEEFITKIKFNLGTYYLLRDEFQKGLELFLKEGEKLKYWNTETIFSRAFNINYNIISSKNNQVEFKKWDGIPRPGYSIIVHAEAGIGDEIINFRFMNNLINYGMIPYWFNSYSDRTSILEVFKRHGYNTLDNLSDIKDDKIIYYVQSMQLPILLNLQYNDLWKGPYLNVNPIYKEKWNHLRTNKLNIGLRWQGNPEYDQDLHRSIDIEQLYNIINTNDNSLFSLQRDTGLEYLNTLSNIKDLSKDLNTWEDTLGIISNMDIIITSCTSIAHAAAALGKRTFIIVPISAYYIYCNSWGELTPWYGDNVTILRQIKPRCWNAPINRLNELLSII